MRDFLQGNRRGKLIDWLKIDSWIDSGLYNSWIGFRDWWAGYSSFFGRFEVKGAVRALNEFACEGLTDMKANLEQHSIKFDERVLPRLNMTQLFYYDPDGIAVECNFPAAETPAG